MQNSERYSDSDASQAFGKETANSLASLQLELNRRYGEIKTLLELEKIKSRNVISKKKFDQIIYDHLEVILPDLYAKFPDLQEHFVPEMKKVIEKLRAEFPPTSRTSRSSRSPDRATSPQSPDQATSPPSPDQPVSPPDPNKEPENEIPLFVREFFQLNAIRGNLWKKADVENWTEPDYLRAIMSYISRDAMKEGVAKIPMLPIWDKLLSSEYNVNSRQGKISLINDIIPTFPSPEMRDNLRYFLNSLKSVESSADFINKVRTDGDPETFFNYLREHTPLPISLKNFFTSSLSINGEGQEPAERIKLAGFGCDLSFGELAQAAVRCLVQRAASEKIEKNNAERNIFHPDAGPHADSITKGIVKDLAILIRNNSPDLKKKDNDSAEEEAKKQEQAEASANLVVNYAIKFVATFVPWPQSDIDIKRYASLIPTKLFRFGPSELKYLEEGLQSGNISVYDKLLIAHFNRLMDSGLNSFVLHVKSVSKDAQTGQITERKESMTLLELLQQHNVVATKNLSEAANNQYNLDANQQELLEKYSKVYVETLPDLINENLPPDPGRYWDGAVDHAKRIWESLKKDPLPMDNLVRKVVSQGIVKDFETKAPQESLRNSLSALFNDINYWMGDAVVKKENKNAGDGQDVLENAMTFNTREEANAYDQENRFLKLRVYRKDAEGNKITKYILMNFQQSFILNPYEEASGQNPNSLRKKLELTDEEFEFIKQDSKRLSGSSGDQYKMLQKLITEKFLFASVKHYLRTQNKTYFTDDEKKVLGEVMSSEYAAKLTANGTGRSLRAILAKRVPALFAKEGKIYPIVSTGIWSNNETVNFLSALPKEPGPYKVRQALKKTNKKKP